MKKIYASLLTLFALSSMAMAQPPDSLIQNVQQHTPRPPDITIQQFVSSWSSGFHAYLNDCVEGVNYDDPEPAEINGILRQDIGNFVLTANNISISPNPQNADLVRANYTLEFSDYALGIHLTQNDSVELKRHPIPDNKMGGKNEYWSIVPGDPQEYFESSSNDAPMPLEHGFTEHMATLVAYPRIMLPKIHLRQSEMQLKQIGLALLMFTQDYNEIIDLNQQNFVEKLTPYMKDVAFFIAPGDTPSVSSYDINPNILGLNLAVFTSPSDTVAFYLGHNQKLDFRYDGLSPVCFMDGHVKAVSPDEAKDLRWEP